MPVNFLPLSETCDEQPRWLWKPYIPIGCVTVLEGHPGNGKTTLLSDITARVSTGRAMPLDPETREPGHVLILNSEDSLASLRTQLCLAGADLTKVVIPETKLLLPDAVTDICRLATERSIRLITIDPLASFSASPISADVPTRKLMDMLTALCQKHGLAVVLVRHWNKTDSASALNRGAGSHVIAAAARSVLIYGSSNSDPSRKILAPSKSNLTRLGPGLIVQTKSHVDGMTIDFGNTTSVGAGEILNAPAQRARPAIEEAKRFLVAFLGDGPAPARDVMTAATTAGISKATLQRAKYELCVESVRQGFGVGSTFRWRLPSMDHHAVEPYWAAEIDQLSNQLFHGDSESLPAPDERPKPETGDDADASPA